MHEYTLSYLLKNYLEENRSCIYIFEEIKSGIFFTALGKYSNVIVMLVVNGILSRLLSPEDYGIVSVVTVFVVFFQLFVDAGFGPAIIQHPKINTKELSSLFNFSVLFGVIAAIIFSIFGYAIASIYNNQIYIKICFLLSLSIVLYGMNIVPVAVLNKQKNFKTISMTQLISSFFSGLVAILCALGGLGVYSLVIMNIVNPLIGFLLFWHKSNLKLQKNFNIDPVKNIWFFAKNQLLFNTINYFSRNADNILIGRFLGSEALGHYSKAYQLLMYPNTILLGVISPVLQPVLRNHQDNVSKIREVYLKVVHILAIIGLPLSVFLMLSSKEVIYVMFGQQWSESVLPFTILSSTVWIQMTLSSSGAIFQSRNKPQYLLLNGIVSASIIVPSIIFGLLFKSIIGVSIFLTIGFYLNFFVSFYLVMKNALSSKLTILLKEFIKPLIVSLVELVILGIINNYFLLESNLLFLLFKGIIFSIVFLVLNYVLGEYNFLKSVYSSKD